MLERATLAFTLILIGVMVMALGVTGRLGVALGALLCPDQIQILGSD